METENVSNVSAVNYSDAKRALKGNRIINIYNKTYNHCEQVKGSIYIPMVSESKLDNSLPLGQFLIVHLRFDHNKNGERILLCFREDVHDS